ncbi:MAG: DNA recombination protein RmuC [Christensenella sp.]|uniref:DNA recombination protein RmuC n=1 Tax=Christensenella sp. TaxID=1935934 RepID=UPI002B21E985|nr:DNA recombination protein RmuC [Christensenella sp.]MEA5004445.1 DNA recombination protein RmuC [Christensenella sp.]
MTENLIWIALIAIAVLCIVILVRQGKKTDDGARQRLELTNQFNLLYNMMLDTMNKVSGANNTSVEILRRTVEDKLSEIQRSVDQKLDTTLKSGLSTSFARVNEQLQQVYQSMGEVRALTSGIGDLKNILSNVKTRGIWGEVQLYRLLADFMVPGQFEENVKIEGDNAVEFAIRLPREEGGATLLPIDSKFPMDRYARVLAMMEAGDLEALRVAQKELVTAVVAEAKKISDKYIRPPKTTDFAIMFLPSEGLYAEVIRLGLIEQLQNKYKVMVTGPSTLSALLTSLQTGFKTLSIKEHSALIIDMIAAIKAEFEQFALLLQKTQNSLCAAQNHLEAVQKRSAKIQTRLSDAEKWEDTED